jgi:hypothetical protein
MSPEQLVLWMNKNEFTVNKLAPLLGISGETIVSYRIGRRPIPKWLELALATLERVRHA